MRAIRSNPLIGGLIATVVAELVVRGSASFLAVPSQLVDLDGDEQLAAVARPFLVPMLGCR